MSTSRRFVAVVVVSALGALVPTGARADWPMNQHDPSRTAASTGAASLERPAIVWSRYVGGSVSASRVVAADVNGDGATDVLLASGGRLLARRADDTPVWASEQYGIEWISGLADFNGDGELDVLAVGFPGFVGIFGGRDGRLEWRTDRASFGARIGAVYTPDFNGDGHPDLYVSDLGCGSTGERGDYGFAYTFARGFGTGREDPSMVLWQREQGRDYNCSIGDIVTDLTGDGRPDLVTFSSSLAWVFDGTTGRKISSGNDAAPTYGGYALGFSIPYGVIAFDPVDVDGDGRTDLVGYTNNSYEPSINSRGVVVLSFDPARAPADRLYVRWRQSVGSVLDDQHVYVENSAADLDRMSGPEIVTSFVTPASAVTYIRRGSDGQTLAQIPGVTIAGVYDLGADQPRTVVVQRGADLVGYRFARFDGGALPAPAFTIPGAQVVTTRDLAVAGRGNRLGEQATLPDPDGIHQAILLTVGGRLELWSVAGATAARVASYDPGGVTITAVAPERNVGGAGPGVLVARSDGSLLALERSLRVVDLGATELPFRGVRTGGYYSGGCGSLGAPVAAHFDRPGDTVFALDSRRVLLRLNTTGASRVSPPTVDWEWPGAVYPLLYDVDGDGTRDVVAATDYLVPRGIRTLTARHGDGSTGAYSRTIPLRETEQLWGDMVPLAQDSGGLHLALATLDFGTGEGRLYGVGPTGAQEFISAPLATASSGQGQIAALDVNGDGRDDPTLMMVNSLRVYDGRSGASLIVGTDGVFSAMPIVTRGRAGGVDLIAAASVGPIAGVGLEPASPAVATRLAPRWSLPPAFAYTQCFAATAPCPDGLRLGTARFGSPHLSVIDATAGAARQEMALAGGRLFASDAEALAATGATSVLGNVTAIRALYGSTAAFLVGSTDGHLYAVDACAATPRLLWEMNFGAPVGQPVFADTDGDGEDELVVSSADGFVHGVDTERFPSPRQVLDTDPEHGIPDTDVDEKQGLSVHALWTPVAGATGYEWAVYTAGGRAVSRRAGDPANPFIPVGASESRAVWTEGVIVGTTYVYAVRAIGAAGTSAEVLSDGVRIIPDGTPQADAGTDGGDSGRDAGTDGSDAAASTDARLGDTGAGIDGGRPTGRLEGGGCFPCAVRGRSPANGRAGALGIAAALALVTMRRRRRGARGAVPRDGGRPGDVARRGVL